MNLSFKCMGNIYTHRHKYMEKRMKEMQPKPLMVFVRNFHSSNVTSQVLLVELTNRMYFYTANNREKV